LRSAELKPVRSKIKAPKFCTAIGIHFASPDCAPKRDQGEAQSGRKRDAQRRVRRRRRDFISTVLNEPQWLGRSLQIAPKSGGSNQLVSERPPSTTIAAPVR
jgi:hypothetical protein